MYIMNNSYSGSRLNSTPSIGFGRAKLQQKYFLSGLTSILASSHQPPSTLQLRWHQTWQSTHGLTQNIINSRLQGNQGPADDPLMTRQPIIIASDAYGMDQGSDFICDFRGPCPALSRPWSGTYPLLAWEPAFEVVHEPPCHPFVARAAAANVNPRTRLSHMTPISGHDWCTRERCCLMMQKSQNFRQMIPRISRRAREFPRNFRESPSTPPPQIGRAHV